MQIEGRTVGIDASRDEHYRDVSRGFTRYQRCDLSDILLFEDKVMNITPPKHSLVYYPK